MYRFIVTVILMLCCVPLWAGRVIVSSDYGGLGTVYSTSTFTTFRGYDRRVKVYTVQENDVQAVVFCYIGLKHGVTSVNANSFALFRHVVFFRPGYLPKTIPDELMPCSRFVSLTSGSIYFWYFNYQFAVDFPVDSAWVVDPSYDPPEAPESSENVYTEDDLRIGSMIFGALLFIPFSRFMRP